MTGRPSIVPCLSYADGNAARAFLETAFGLRTVFALNDAEGALLHAEMAFGDGVVMLGTADLPRGSPGLYLLVADVDAHHARAAWAGAEIVYPPEDTEFGTRRYRTRDPAGHEWSFGSYQPQPTAPEW